MNLWKRDLQLVGSVLACGLAVAASAANTPQPLPSFPGMPQRTLIRDGSVVHDAGTAGLNITNWGLLGSLPGSTLPFSHAPSFDVPAHSGNNYLYGAGLWIGALVGGIPHVTTGQYQVEVASDPDDPLDTIYRSVEGAPGARRFPDPAADDDSDGAIDEDPPNGRDDDQDGRVDEDYGAVGQQDYRCVMRDDSSALTDPNHVPMHVEVVQTSHAWSAAAEAPGIGFDYVITNRGDVPLQDVYLGMFADFDIGPDHEDDLPGFWRGRFRDEAGAFVPIALAYGYDADGDNGASIGYFGMLLLDHSTDPAGETAPTQFALHGFQQFNNSSPFAGGGDPTNDAERYQVLAQGGFDHSPTDPGKAGDYRMLISVGPFGTLAPGASVHFDLAFVWGAGIDGLRRNCAEIAMYYDGRWYDQDHDPTTGIKGRDRRVCLSDYGDPGPQNPVYSLYQDCVTPEQLQGPNPPLPIGPGDLDPQGCIWIDSDCATEADAGATDCTRDGEGATPAELAGCTGVLGRESRVRWIQGGGAVPTPRGSLAAAVRDGKVVLQAGVDMLFGDGFRLDRVAEAHVSGRSWALTEGAWSGSNASHFGAQVLDDDATGWPRHYALVLQWPQRDVVLAQIDVSSEPGPPLALEASPNPFNPRTTLSLRLQADEQVAVTVHDARGRLVRQLLAGPLPAGTHQLSWNGLDAAGRPAASGMYIARATAGRRAVTHRLLLVR